MPLFDSLSNTQRSLIASSLEPVSFDGGDVIFEEGDHGDYFFIVEAGGVKVIKQRATTGEIVLTEIGAGGYFGELAFFGQRIAHSQAAQSQHGKVEKEGGGRV